MGFVFVSCWKPFCFSPTLHPKCQTAPQFHQVRWNCVLANNDVIDFVIFIQLDLLLLICFSKLTISLNMICIIALASDFLQAGLQSSLRGKLYFLHQLVDFLLCSGVSVNLFFRRMFMCLHLLNVYLFPCIRLCFPQVFGSPLKQYKIKQ